MNTTNKARKNNIGLYIADVLPHGTVKKIRHKKNRQTDRKIVRKAINGREV